jgi:proteic killer suppression protein
LIRSFKSADAASLFEDRAVRRFQSIERTARRKLLYLDQARRLEDLRVPPGNRLELLRGGRFAWRDGDAHDVEIVDCH